MSEFEKERRGSDERHGRFVRVDYQYHSWLFNKVFDTVSKDIRRQGGKSWPWFVHASHECACHPTRVSVRSRCEVASSQS